MKPKFRFDKKTGTMVPATDSDAVQIPAKQEGVEEVKAPAPAPPAFQREKRLVEPAPQTSGSDRVLKMKRVGSVTPVQLIGENGMVEDYLDTDDTDVLMFRAGEDYDICQITDDRSGKVLAYIGGYALEINFNMAELDTMEKIEKCLEGIVKLFRHKLMRQNLRPGQKA